MSGGRFPLPRKSSCAFCRNCNSARQTGHRWVSPDGDAKWSLRPSRPENADALIPCARDAVLMRHEAPTGSLHKMQRFGDLPLSNGIAGRPDRYAVKRWRSAFTMALETSSIWLESPRRLSSPSNQSPTRPSRPRIASRSSCASSGSSSAKRQISPIAQSASRTRRTRPSLSDTDATTSGGCLPSAFRYSTSSRSRQSALGAAALRLPSTWLRAIARNASA